MRLEQDPAAALLDFQVRVANTGNRPTVVVRGEVDRATVGEFSAALDTAMRMGSSIELDLRDMTFIDSVGLRVLLTAQLRLGQLPEAIVLREPCLVLRRLLALAGVEGLFNVR